MGKILSKPRTSALIILSSILALGSIGCQDTEPNSLDNPTTTAVSKLVPQPEPSSSTQLVASSTNNTPPQPDPYPEALDIAVGADLLTKSAIIREDWGLVAIRWQEAIQLLAKVPPSSPNYQLAQTKQSEYKTFLAQALEKATPPPKPQPQAQGDSTPNFFLVPIKRRLSGIPIVEVEFNNTHKFEMAFDTGATKTLITGSMATNLGLKPVGTKLVGVADGSIVELPIAVLKSIAIDSRLKRNVTVAVAPNMPVGLLGQDFFSGYDVTIKKNVIEFRQH